MRRAREPHLVGHGRAPPRVRVRVLMWRLRLLLVVVVAAAAVVVAAAAVAAVVVVVAMFVVRVLM